MTSNLFYKIINFGKVIGKYMGHDIYDSITISDGRIFTYESIAISIPGTIGFHRDFNNKGYLLVHGDLLYRQL